MPSRFLTTAAAIVVAAPWMSRANLVLAEKGTAVLPVVVGADVSAAERTAASELKNYLGRITGGAFAVQEEAASGELRAGIYVGRTRFSAAPADADGPSRMSPSSPAHTSQNTHTRSIALSLSRR